MRKLALVIGVGQYADGNNNNLPNAINDARDITNALKRIDNLEINGNNILNHAINAQDVLDHINSREPFATVFILDCCRKYHLRNPHLDKCSRATEINQSSGLREMSNEHESLPYFNPVRFDKHEGLNVSFAKSSIVNK